MLTNLLVNCFLQKKILVVYSVISAYLNEKDPLIYLYLVFIWYDDNGHSAVIY